MATIRAYTTIEQSRKLAAFLPLESADICYPLPYENGDKPLLEQGGFGSTPCWSLAALLNTLPVIIGDIFSKNALRLRMDNGETNFNVWYVNIDSTTVEEGLDIIKSNPVDACYEMILKLHELNLL